MNVDMIIGFSSTEYTSFEQNEEVMICIDVISHTGAALRPFTVVVLPVSGISIA